MRSRSALPLVSYKNLFVCLSKNLKCATYLELWNRFITPVLEYNYSASCCSVFYCYPFSAESSRFSAESSRFSAASSFFSSASNRTSYACCPLGGRRCSRRIARYPKECFSLFHIGSILNDSTISVSLPIGHFSCFSRRYSLIPSWGGNLPLSFAPDETLSTRAWSIIVILQSLLYTLHNIPNIRIQNIRPSRQTHTHPEKADAQ